MAFQIKTTNADDHHSYSYVDEEHLAYWQSLEVPVFAVLVDLPNQAMYLRQITTSESYPTTPEGRIRIEFDVAGSEFGESSAGVIRIAAEKLAFEEIHEYLVPVRNGIETIRDALRKAERNPEPHVLIEIMMRRNGWKDSLARAEVLARSFRTAERECSDVATELEAALHELREFMIDWNMEKDWDDSKYREGEIRRFIDEGH